MAEKKVTQNVWTWGFAKKEEGAVSNNNENAFENLVHTNLKQLPKRLKLGCQNEIHQVMFKCVISAKNNENSLQINLYISTTRYVRKAIITPVKFL